MEFLLKACLEVVSGGLVGAHTQCLGTKTEAKQLRFRTTQFGLPDWVTPYKSVEVKICQS